MTDTTNKTITQARMDQLITTGQAYPWTQPLGGVVPVIARHDGAWWIVLDTNDDRDDSVGCGEQMYRRAPRQLADTLDRVSAVPRPRRHSGRRGRSRHTQRPPEHAQPRPQRRPRGRAGRMSRPRDGAMIGRTPQSRCPATATATSHGASLFA